MAYNPGMEYVVLFGPRLDPIKNKASFPFPSILLMGNIPGFKFGSWHLIWGAFRHLAKDRGFNGS